MTTLEIIITILAVLLLIFLVTPVNRETEAMQKNLEDIYLNDCISLSNVDIESLQDPVFIGFLREYKIYKSCDKNYKILNLDI
jgi:hypothetical protein